MDDIKAIRGTFVIYQDSQGRYKGIGISGYFYQIGNLQEAMAIIEKYVIDERKEK
jgi:hypothetical protein